MKKPLRKLSARPPMVEVVRRAILESICNGQFKPEERLAQSRIAKMLHVSCQPVAQALGLLKTQGFVCDAGRRGLMVVPLDIDFVEELYDYRIILEPALASKAASRGPSAENGVAAEKAIAQSCRAAEEGDILSFVAGEAAFHKWIYKRAGNRIMLQSMVYCWKHMQRVISATLTEHPDAMGAERRRMSLVTDHKSILSAILAGDCRLAEQLARDHVGKSREVNLQLIHVYHQHVAEQG